MPPLITTRAHTLIAKIIFILIMSVVSSEMTKNVQSHLMRVNMLRDMIGLNDSDVTTI